MLSLLITTALITNTKASLNLDCEYFLDLTYSGSDYSAIVEGLYPLNKCIPTYTPWTNSFTSEIYSCNAQGNNIKIDFYDGPSCQGSIQYSETADSVQDFNCNGGQCNLFSFQSELRSTSSNTTCPAQQNLNDDLTSIWYGITDVCTPFNGTLLFGIESASYIESCDQSSNSYSRLLYANNDCSGDSVLNLGDSVGNCVNYASYGFPGECDCIDWINCNGGDSDSNQLPTPPTTEPTPTPSSATTAEPTTGLPTEDPTTMEPTPPTTAAPTGNPTAETMSPSNDPTMEPTDDPTKDPTQVTSMPSGSPTSDPTSSPVDEAEVDISGGGRNGGLFGCLVIVMIFVGKIM